MAGKKKEGLDGVKGTTGGKRREDKEAIDRNSFDPLSVDAKTVQTVVCLLQSPEEIIQLRAVAALEVFGSKDRENLELLCSLDIFDNIYPILSHPDFVARRFALKLIGILCSLEDFRAQVLRKEDILETFTDILKKENDAVLQEYASLTLAELSNEHQVASDLLKVKDCLATLFLRLISADPDIEKNCLEIMIHLLNDLNGVEVFIESPSFEMKTILNLISSSYPVIQALVIEVLTLLTAWCRDNRVMYEFRDAMGSELVLKILETSDFADLHSGALDLMLNVTDCPEMCEYLLKSGCLRRFLQLLDDCVETSAVNKILGVIARMAQTTKGREALHLVEMEKRFVAYLEVQHDSIQESSCLGIANLAQNCHSLQTLVDLNPTMNLLGIIVDGEKSIKLRNMAAYALNIMTNADKRPANVLVENDGYKGLFTVLTDNSNLTTELCQNVIQVFVGISLYDELRIDIISENFLSALMSCLPSADPCIKKDPSVQVDTLECLSEYMIESEAQVLFNQLDGAEVLIRCLKSKFASVREWAGHLVVVASQSKEFIEDFIRAEGLDWMLKEKNTTYSMPSWQSAIETIFANCLPAKFAYTGRLDFQDITQDEFYISVNPKLRFLTLDYFFDMMISPVAPLYVANFNTTKKITLTESESTTTSSEEGNRVSEKAETPPIPRKKLIKLMKGADRDSTVEYNWDGSLLSYPSVDYEEGIERSRESIPLQKCTPDPYLNEYLENLRKKIAKEESQLEDMNWTCLHPRIVCSRAKIIAEFVADEMSGLDPNISCKSHYKAAHINELKYYLATNILPLGLIRIGDYLERAMLFKVLADRTGFPCALVRGPCGRAWIEITVPVINVEDPDRTVRDSIFEPGSKDSIIASSENVNFGSQESSETPCSSESVAEEEGFWFRKIQLESFKPFPKDFLKPNAIVDLVIQPGRIMPMQSLEANEYCGEFLIQWNK